jgi:hypothetical protein
VQLDREPSRLPLIAVLDNIADNFLQRQADDVGHSPRQLVVIAEALDPTYRAPNRSLIGRQSSSRAGHGRV